MANIIGKFRARRMATNEVIQGEISDLKEGQDIQNGIYFTGIPLITEMVAAKKDCKDEFIAGTYKYYILEIEHPDLIRKKEKQVIFRNSETINIITTKSFNGVTTHCPNCDIRDNELLQYIKAHIQRKSNPKKFIVISGVLHCENCDYYYVSKFLLQSLPNKIKKDLGVQLTEIKLDDHGRIIKDDWRGATDSILSRNGYIADGSLKSSERKEVIRHIIKNNVGSFYDIQSHLIWLINTRSKRNPNAADIWKDDLKWMELEFGKSNPIKGKLR